MAIAEYWPAEIRLGAFLDGGGDIDHLGVARRHCEHLAAGEQAVEHRSEPADDGNQNHIHVRFFPCLTGARGCGLPVRAVLWCPQGSTSEVEWL
jgi:hypothetical protein